MRTTSSIPWLLVACCVAIPAPVRAQGRPFVFSLSTTPVQPDPVIRVDYEIGGGESAFHQQAADGPEQRIGIDATRGRLRFVAHVGLTSTTATYETSQQAEVLVTLFNHGRSGVALAAGGGLLHEAGDTTVLLGRIVVGRETERQLLHGNVVFQRPFEAGRDAVDLITSVGWAARVSPAWSAGIEVLGEDLEGFWDAQEAEGGARLLVGPSVRFAPSDKQWDVIAVGGPTFHPQASSRQSDAVRDLPATSASLSYVARVLLSWRF